MGRKTDNMFKPEKNRATLMLINNLKMWRWPNQGRCHTQVGSFLILTRLQKRSIILQ